jgi:cell division protein FtsL
MLLVIRSNFKTRQTFTETLQAITREEQLKRDVERLQDDRKKAALQKQVHSHFLLSSFFILPSSFSFSSSLIFLS